MNALPPEAVSRRGDEVLREHFPGADSNRILVVVRYPDGTPLTAERVGGLYDLSRWLAARPNVARVESLVDLDPSVTREQYQQLATAPAEMRPPGVTQLLRQTVGGRLALLVVSTALKPSSTRGARPRRGDPRVASAARGRGARDRARPPSISTSSTWSRATPR